MPRVGSAPLSLRACFLSSLRRRRMASARFRIRFSEGFSYARLAFMSRKTPSRCILFLSTRSAWSILLSRTDTCKISPVSVVAHSGGFRRTFWPTCFSASNAEVAVVALCLDRCGLHEPGESVFGWAKGRWPRSTAGTQPVQTSLG